MRTIDCLISMVMLLVSSYNAKEETSTVIMWLVQFGHIYITHN